MSRTPCLWKLALKVLSSAILMQSTTLTSPNNVLEPTRAMQITSRNPQGPCRISHCFFPSTSCLAHGFLTSSARLGQPICLALGVIAAKGLGVYQHLINCCNWFGKLFMINVKRSQTNLWKLSNQETTMDRTSCTGFPARNISTAVVAISRHFSMFLYFPPT